MSIDEKRMILRQKVDDRKQHLAARNIPVESDKNGTVEEAASPPSFVKKHPIPLIGGALAVGLMIGLRGKKKAVKAATPAKKAPKTNLIVSLLAEAAIIKGLKMIDKARTQEPQDTEEE